MTTVAISMFCSVSESIFDDSLRHPNDHPNSKLSRQTRSVDLIRAFLSFLDDDKRSLECWICYDPDRQDRGSMIQPCNCKGDVGAVHHDCLRRWLVEVSF